MAFRARRKRRLSDLGSRRGDHLFSFVGARNAAILAASGMAAGLWLVPFVHGDPGPSKAASGPVSTADTGARCIGTGFDDTAAFQAAIDTGRTVYAPALNGSCNITRPQLVPS